jgi:phage terminase small subunit
MTATGRRPFVTTESVGFGERLKPPNGLAEPERKVFLDLVRACPAAQFTAADTPLIVTYAELIVLRERTAKELRNAPLIVTDDKGHERANPLINVHATAVKGLTGLSLRLRLAPQSRMQQAPRTKAGPMSFYDVKNQEREAADGEEADEAPTQ